jgi:hypothetical protein
MRWARQISRWALLEMSPSDTNLSRLNHRERLGKLLTVFGDNRRCNGSLLDRVDPMEPQENYSGVRSPLAKYQLAKVLVRCHQEGIFLGSKRKHIVVGDSRIHLRYVHDVMPTRPERFDDLTLHPFVA